LSQKLGEPEPKTVGKLLPISTPDLGDRSHCISLKLNCNWSFPSISSLC